MATMQIPNFAGASETVEKPLTPGRAAATNARPIALSNEDLAALNEISTRIGALTATPDQDPAAASASYLSLFRGFFQYLKTLVDSHLSINVKLRDALGVDVPFNDLIDTIETPLVIAVRTAAYTIGQGIGPLNLMEDFARSDGKGGWISRFQLRSLTAVTAPTHLHLFRDEPTASTFSTISANVALVIHASDRIKRITTITIPAAWWISPQGANGEYSVELVSPALGRDFIPYKKINGGRNLWWAWECGGSQGAFGATTSVSYVAAADNN